MWVWRVTLGTRLRMFGWPWPTQVGSGGGLKWLLRLSPWPLTQRADIDYEWRTVGRRDEMKAEKQEWRKKAEKVASRPSLLPTIPIVPPPRPPALTLPSHPEERLYDAHWAAWQAHTQLTSGLGCQFISIQFWHLSVTLCQILAQ